MPFNIGGTFTGPIPSYAEYSTPLNITSPTPYFQPNPDFTNPTYSVDTTRMPSIRTGFEKPTFLEQFGQSFYRNFPDYLGGGRSSVPYGTAPGAIPGVRGDRFAGTDPRMLELLRRLSDATSTGARTDIERGIRLSPRKASIYSGSMD